MNADTLADQPAPEILREQLEATYRLIAQHHAVCPGCQNMLRCPVYARIKAEQEAVLDAACRAMLGRR